jgi:macrolide transport system ATP-binding/permease protein
MLLQCKNIKKEYGLQTVLKSVSFDLEEGGRVGLVGKNGGGKTTLANIIAGSLQADSGEVIWHRKDVQIGYLRQSVYYTADFMKELYDDHRGSVALSDFLHITSELGTDKIAQWESERFEALSGGEKTKLALAHIWSSKPQLLILDEPTNHLDYQGLQWLVEELRDYPGTILTISHDRYFLDQVVSRILEIANGEIIEYNGNYTFYRNEKRKRYETQLRAYEVQEKYKDKLEAEIRQIKDWSAKAHRDSTRGSQSGNKMGMKEYNRVKAKKMDKQVKSTVKRLEKLREEGIKSPDKEPKLSFAFQQGETHRNRVMEACQLQKSFGSLTLFEESDFYILRGDRVGLFGPNGCGKTTLVKAILGRESVKGRLFVSPSVSIGYISQDVSDLEGDERALDIFEMPNRKEEGRVRTMLANLGFNELLLSKPLKALSMGERTKLKIAHLLMNRNDLLILDEPTNHLDIYAREQLEEALIEYQGTILLITHDRYMMEKICDKLLIFENQRIKRVEYGLTHYLKRKSRQQDGDLNDNKKESGLTADEERMLLENQISVVLSKFNNLEEGTPEYQALEEEFNQLISQRARLEK